MEGLGQYLKLSGTARLLIFHTYKMNEEGERVTKTKLERRFGEDMTRECLEEIFKQPEPLLERHRNMSYTVPSLIKDYFCLLR